MEVVMEEVTAVGVVDEEEVMEDIEEVVAMEEVDIEVDTEVVEASQVDTEVVEASQEVMEEVIPNKVRIINTSTTLDNKVKVKMQGSLLRARFHLITY
jgi:hypothetical protein